MSAPYRILHVSDIHFGRNFDFSLWEYLTELRRRQAPDLIACTGDIVNHGGLFMLATARKQLEELANDGEQAALLRTVPGNHDVGPWGNFRLPFFGSNFTEVFGSKPLDLPEWIPPFLRYQRMSRTKRALVWCWGTLVLYLLRLKKLLKGEAGDLPLFKDDDPQNVLLLYLDSNHAQTLATGNVDVKKLTSLQAGMLAFRKKSPNQAIVPRIALIHHHPLPIPYSDIKEGLTSFEPFLVLRNAGTVVHQLCSHDFDLVLHGHKHYPGFCRLGYNPDTLAEGELAVLSAGSAGVTYGEAGRNCVNLVELHPSGRIAYTRIFYGSGQSTAIAALDRSAQTVHPIATHKRRAFRRAQELQLQECEMVASEVTIDESGTASVAQRFSKLRLEGSREYRKRHSQIAFELGRVNPSTIQLDEASRAKGYELTVEPETPAKNVDLTVDFRQNLSSLSGPVDYGMRHTTINSFAMTRWETEQLRARKLRQQAAELAAIKDSKARERRKREQASDRIMVGREMYSEDVAIPLRRLQITLRLPANLQNPSPDVRVLRAANYPQIHMNANGEFVAMIDEAAEDEDDASLESGLWIPDQIMTQHERSSFVQLGDREWRLDVEYPLVGHAYEITWSVSSSEEISLLPYAAKAAGLRKVLVQAVNEHGEVSKRFAGEAGDFLNELAKYIQSEHGSQQQYDEVVSVALYAYDDTQQCLRRIAAGNSAGEVDSDLFEIPLGEGVSGAAFKRRRPTFYVSPKLPGGAMGGAYLYYPEGTRPKYDYQVLMAFPLFHPDAVGDSAVRPPQETIGIFTIASTAIDSRLVELLPVAASAEYDAASHLPDPEKQEEGITELWTLADVALNRLTEELAPKPAVA